MHHLIVLHTHTHIHILLLLLLLLFYAFITLDEHIVFLGSIVNSWLYWISWCLLHSHTYKRIMYYVRTAVLTGHLSYEFIFYFSAGSSLQQRIPMEIISFSYLSDRCRAHNICIFQSGGIVRNTFHIFFLLILLRLYPINYIYAAILWIRTYRYLYVKTIEWEIIIWIFLVLIPFYCPEAYRQKLLYENYIFIVWNSRLCPLGFFLWNMCTYKRHNHCMYYFSK